MLNFDSLYPFFGPFGSLDCGLHSLLKVSDGWYFFIFDRSEGYWSTFCKIDSNLVLLDETITLVEIRDFFINKSNWHPFKFSKEIKSGMSPGT